MTPEERSLLERTYKLAEENNEILKKIRRSSRISLMLRVGYWVVILGISFGAFYLIQPYVDAITGNNSNDSTNNSSSSIELLKSLLN